MAANEYGTARELCIKLSRMTEDDPAFAEARREYRKAWEAWMTSMGCEFTPLEEVNNVSD